MIVLATVNQANKLVMLAYLPASLFIFHSILLGWQFLTWPVCSTWILSTQKFGSQLLVSSSTNSHLSLYFAVQHLFKFENPMRLGPFNSLIYSLDSQFEFDMFIILTQIYNLFSSWWFTWFGGHKSTYVLC